jgi:hypothetical protein
MPQAILEAMKRAARWVLPALLLSAATGALADPATASFASGQLEVAQAALRSAQAAFAAHEYSKVLGLAAQASVDARLAWGMTESGFARRAAIDINAQAERMRQMAIVASGGIATSQR